MPAYTAATGAGQVSGDMRRRQLTRAVVASTIGSTIEWYDTTLYGLLVPLYIGRLFFPSGDPVTSALAGFSSLLVSFAFRPVGGALFGHFGDRLGRKATLVATLLLGGVATTLIGLVPTYAEIGIAAPILITVLRMFVGMSLGGEWGGAVLMALEWSNDRRRGLWASVPQMAIVGATVLGFLAVLGSRALVGADSWWVWRLPFLLSILLVAVGLYMRLGILETPAFVRLLETRRPERQPVLRVVRWQGRELALTALLRMGEQAPLLVFTTFFLVYATTALHFKQGTAVIISILSGLFGVACPPLFGYLGDRIGRRRVFLLGACAMIVYGIPYFWLLGTRNAAVVLAAQIVGQVIAAAMAGPEAALIPEAFTGRLRYSGASIGAGVGAFISGGLASIIATGLFQHFRNATPVGIYIVFCGLVSWMAASRLTERSDQDLSVEYDDAPELPGARVTVRAR